jgi:hypothetical protein
MHRRILRLAPGAARPALIKLEPVMPRDPKVIVKDNSLYIFIRGNPPPTVLDHHGLYRHKEGNGGTQYHTHNVGSGWMVETCVTHGLPEFMGTILLLRIGVIPEDKMVAFESVINEIAVHNTMTQPSTVSFG